MRFTGPKIMASSRKSVAARRPGRIAKTEISAGGIVFKRTPRGLRLALMLDPYGRWAFAKGHVEPGESLKAAALREAREELGLGRLKIVAPLGRIDFWFRDRYRPESRGTLIHKYVHYFLMEAPPSAHGQPLKQEKIAGLAWVDLAQACRQSGYRDARPILRRAESFLLRREPRRLPSPVRKPVRRIRP